MQDCRQLQETMYTWSDYNQQRSDLAALSNRPSSLAPFSTELCTIITIVENNKKRISTRFPLANRKEYSFGGLLFLSFFPSLPLFPSIDYPTNPPKQCACAVMTNFPLSHFYDGHTHSTVQFTFQVVRFYHHYRCIFIIIVANYAIANSIPFLNIFPFCCYYYILRSIPCYSRHISIKPALQPSAAALRAVSISPTLQLEWFSSSSIYIQ